MSFSVTSAAACSCCSVLTLLVQQLQSRLSGSRELRPCRFLSGCTGIEVIGWAGGLGREPTPKSVPFPHPQDRSSQPAVDFAGANIQPCETLLAKGGSEETLVGGADIRRRVILVTGLVSPVKCSCPSSSRNLEPLNDSRTSTLEVHLSPLVSII